MILRHITMTGFSMGIIFHNITVGQDILPKQYYMKKRRRKL